MQEHAEGHIHAKTAQTSTPQQPAQQLMNFIHISAATARASTEPKKNNLYEYMTRTWVYTSWPEQIRKAAIDNRVLLSNSRHSAAKQMS
jgi:hypothetical protein